MHQALCTAGEDEKKYFFSFYRHRRTFINVKTICILLLLSHIAHFSTEADTVYQPHFVRSGLPNCQSGTGCFVRGPSGQIFALTCAHVVPRGRRSVQAVEWIGQGPDNTTVRLQSQPHHYDASQDVALFIPKHPATVTHALELQSGSHYRLGAAIWLPNRSVTSPQGYERITGAITGQTPQFVIVTLDQPIDLQARSGTPVLLEQTGKVIGILSRGDTSNGQTHLYLVPAHVIYPHVKQRRYSSGLGRVSADV